MYVIFRSGEIIIKDYVKRTEITKISNYKNIEKLIGVGGLCQYHKKTYFIFEKEYLTLKNREKKNNKSQGLKNRISLVKKHLIYFRYRESRF